MQFCSGPYGWPYRKVTELTILNDTDGNLRGPEQLPLPPSITRAWAQTDTEADTKARAMIHNAHTRLTHCGRGPCTLPGYHDGPCSY